MGEGADLVTRLRVLAGEAKAMLALAQAAEERGALALSMRLRLPEWIGTLQGLLADVDRQSAIAEPTTRDLLARALSGADLDLDGVLFSLHDITQLAAALRPGASLTVRNSECLTPIEQTSIWTVMPGQVRFA